MYYRSVAGALFLGLVVSGCSNTPPRVHPLPISSSAGADAVAQYDVDKDGRISGDELEKCAALKAAIQQIDADGDGAITAVEITDRIGAWQKSKLGRMPVSCTVLRNGRPLVDADVKFVPEKFLGDEMKVAQGKTSQNGVAMISFEIVDPAKDRPGVSPGLYRIEITKEGESIPAKYNTETTLGQEVANDAAGIREGIRLNLQY